MAIFFTKEDTLSRYKPENGKYFEPEELFAIMGSKNIRPVKIGPVWLIINEDLENSPQDKNFHLLATEFFRMDIWGDVFIVSSFELPQDWNLIGENEKGLTAEIADAGFIKAVDDFCRSMGITIKWIGSIEGELIKQLLGEENKNKYNYYPKKQTPEARESEDFKKFLSSTIPFIVQYTDINKEMLIFQDDDVEITVIDEEDKKDTIKQLLEFCLETERYEEAAEIKRVYDKINK